MEAEKVRVPRQKTRRSRGGTTGQSLLFAKVSTDRSVCSLYFFFFSSRRRHTRFLNVTGVQTCCSSESRLNSSHIQKSRMPSSACDWRSDVDRKSTRLNSSHIQKSRMPSSAWKKKTTCLQSAQMGSKPLASAYSASISSV